MYWRSVCEKLLCSISLLIKSYYEVENYFGSNDFKWEYLVMGCFCFCFRSCKFIIEYWEVFSCVRKYDEVM